MKRVDCCVLACLVSSLEVLLVIPAVAADADRLRPKRTVAPAVVSVAFAPDGSWLAAARNREIVIIDVGAGAVRETLAGAENPVNALAVSPDGRHVAAGEGEAGAAGAVLVWEIGKPEPRRMTGHSDSIYAVAFSPDGARLVTASYDKLLILWNLATGEPVATLKHHTGPVFSAQFSPDGKSIVSGGADQTVKLWNAETGERILTLGEATKGVNAAAFHPQGIELAAAGADRTIRLYEWNGTTARFKRGTIAHDAPIL
ncbi:MAG: WD40 repeat domain-containing protein, partial [Planctomycetaceae bacterium]